LHKRFRALYGFLAKKKNRVHPVHVFPTRKQKAAQELSSSINQNLWPRGFWWASVISSARRKRGNGIGDEATGFFVCIFTEPFPQSWISSNIFPACDRVTRSNFYSNDLVVDWPATWNLYLIAMMTWKILDYGYEDGQSSYFGTFLEPLSLLSCAVHFWVGLKACK
jgi:hypothetical protein